ncbi:MAG: TonB-dependent siderophore receptor [Pseudomonadota bacterium]
MAATAITFIGGLTLAAPVFADAELSAEAAYDAANPQVQETIVVRDKFLANEKFSGTKTLTPLVDVPQSLTVISREQIEDQFFIDIGDVTRFTPGVSIGQGEGHRDQITIRGQNTTADFFIDGVRDDVQYFRPLYNLQQVEILRGSNALIFGRGGGGGVVNRVTKKALAGEAFGSATASVDTFGSFLFAGDGNIGIGEAGAFRLNAFYEDLDNHRDFFGGERFAINPTTTFELTPDTRLIVSYEYVDDDRVVDRGAPSLDGTPLEGFDETYFGDPDFNRTTLQAHIARARLDHNFSDGLSFNTTIQYADYDKLYQNLFPVGIALGGLSSCSASLGAVEGDVCLDGYIDTTDRQNLIIQSNLVGEFDTGFLGHTLLFGVEYGDQDTANSRRDTFFADSADDQIAFAFTDPLAIPEVTFPVLNRDRDSKVDFISVYIQDQIDVGDHVKLVGGVRYDRFEVDVLNRDASQLAGTGGAPLELGRVDEEISPRVGLIYKPQDNVSLYASWSQSFLPRSGDQFLVLTPSTESLAPEEFENIEVGAKWDLTNRLALTASLFQLDRESGTTVDPNDVGNLLIIGSRTRGFEVQLNGELLPDWYVNTGYSYLDADERGRIVDGAIANRTLSQVPEHMFFVFSRYDLSERFGVGLGVTYQSEQFASISNAVELPDFTRVDAAIYYQLTDAVELQVNVENLFDADFFPSAHNDNNITPAEPLNARFTLTTRF